MSYRAAFAHRWAVFIRENFESPEHAAMVFGVDGTTARKWWEGLHRPSGDVVSWAYATWPEETAEALRPD